MSYEPEIGKEKELGEQSEKPNIPAQRQRSAFAYKLNTVLVTVIDRYFG